jgi:hypothetical protein
MNTVSIDDIFHPLDPNNPGQFLTTASSFGGPGDMEDNPDPSFRFGEYGAGGRSSVMPDGSINPIDYAALPPGMDKYIQPGSEFDVINPKTGKRVRVIYKDEGPGTKMRGLDVAPHTLQKLGASTDDKLIVDFTPAFSGPSATPAPSPASENSSSGLVPYDSKQTPHGKMPEMMAAQEEDDPSGDEQTIDDSEQLTAFNAKDDFSKLDPRAQLLAGKYTKDDIASVNRETGTVTYKNGLQVNPKMGWYSVAANGKRFLYSAAAPTKIAAVTEDPEFQLKKVDQKARETAASKFGIFPAQFGLGQGQDTEDKWNAYNTAVTKALNPQSEQYQMQKVNETLDYIQNQIDPDISNWTTGSGGKIMRNVPLLPTEAKYFQDKLDSLKNRLGLNELQEMRNASKSGGALGQISDRENEILQNSVAALNSSLSPQQLQEQIGIIKKHLEVWKQAKEAAGVTHVLPPKTEIPFVGSAEEYAKVPPGGYYEDSQGIKRKPNE